MDVKKLDGLLRKIESREARRWVNGVYMRLDGEGACIGTKRKPTIVGSLVLTHGQARTLRNALCAAYGIPARVSVRSIHRRLVWVC
jgi:hypothetical protein